jgi:RNA polymerase sigma-70 factor (ECF subfamily)
MALHARRDDLAEGAAHQASSSGFEEFFKQNYPTVMRLAYGVVGDFQRAQDVAQEVFLAAHRRFPESTAQASGWVRVAAVHTALNMIRSERRRHRRDLEARHHTCLPSAEDAVIEREGREELRRALSHLPRRSAAALVMRHGGMSYVEIAEALAIKPGNVGTLLRRAESALLKEMDHATRS